MSSKTISFGILYVPLQLLDIAGPMDVIVNCSRPIMEVVSQFMPDIDEAAAKKLLDAAFDSKIHHIGPTMSPVELTGGFLVQPTCTVENCPPLDYLLVGGPDPKYCVPGGEMPESMKEFIRNRSTEVKTVFSTCTGGMVLAAAGVLDGVKATANHSALPMAAQLFPAVQWDNSVNWVENGKFWTAAGATAGMDMFTHWVRTQAGDGVVDCCTQILEYQPRDVQGRMMSYVNGRGERISV